MCVDVTVERGEKRDGLERLLRIQRARAGRKEKKETKEKKEKKETSGVAALIGFGFIFFSFLSQRQRYTRRRVGGSPKTAATVHNFLYRHNIINNHSDNDSRGCTDSLVRSALLFSPLSLSPSCPPQDHSFKYILLLDEID